jgi:hypothetical protein
MNRRAARLSDHAAQEARLSRAGDVESQGGKALNREMLKALHKKTAQPSRSRAPNVFRTVLLIVYITGAWVYGIW